MAVVAPPINLFTLLPNTVIDAIVLNADNETQMTLYNLDVLTRYTLLDNITINKLFRPQLTFPVTNQATSNYYNAFSEQYYQYYSDILDNNPQRLYDQDVTKTLYVLIGLMFNQYRRNGRLSPDEMATAMIRIFNLVLTHIQRRHNINTSAFKRIGIVAPVALPGSIYDYRQQSLRLITLKLKESSEDAPIESYLAIYTYFFMYQLIILDYFDFYARDATTKPAFYRLVTNDDRRHTINNIAYSILYMTSLVGSDYNIVDYTKYIPSLDNGEPAAMNLSQLDKRLYNSYILSYISYRPKEKRITDSTVIAGLILQRDSEDYKYYQKMKEDTRILRQESYNAREISYMYKQLFGTSRDVYQNGLAVKNVKPFRINRIRAFYGLEEITPDMIPKNDDYFVIPSVVSNQ